MVLPPGEQHGVGGGLRSLTAFLVKLSTTITTTVTTTTTRKTTTTSTYICTYPAEAFLGVVKSLIAPSPLLIQLRQLLPLPLHVPYKGLSPGRRKSGRCQCVSHAVACILQRWPTNAGSRTASFPWLPCAPADARSQRSCLASHEPAVPSSMPRLSDDPLRNDDTSCSSSSCSTGSSITSSSSSYLASHKPAVLPKQGLRATSERRSSMQRRH